VEENSKRQWNDALDYPVSSQDSPGLHSRHGENHHLRNFLVTMNLRNGVSNPKDLLNKLLKVSTFDQGLCDTVFAIFTSLPRIILNTM
jgi:hypothetical protein